MRTRSWSESLFTQQQPQPRRDGSSNQRWGGERTRFSESQNSLADFVPTQTLVSAYAEIEKAARMH